MPLIIRGEQGKSLLKPRTGCVTTYTMTSPKDGEVTFPVFVAIVYAKGRRGERKANKHADVALRCTASPRTVFDRYRERFGIEASFRLANHARARTKSDRLNIDATLTPRKRATRRRSEEGGNY